MTSTSVLTDMSLDELASFVARKGQGTAVAGGVTLPHVEGIPPLSYGQERMVFMDRLSGGTSFYNLAYGHVMEGLLDLEALSRAWLHVVGRHETLHSCFPDDEKGKPCLRFIPASACALRFSDLRELGLAERLERVDREVNGMISKAYNLKEGPLARGIVLQEADQRFVFLYGFHHSVFDGWSLTVFHQELFKGYEAYCAGTEPDLPLMSATHGQYALWQRNRVEGAFGQEEERWWQEYLSDVRDLNLVADKSRPEVQGFDGDSVEFTVSQDVRISLEKAAKKVGASPFMLWTAILALVLGKYSGQKDFAIGGSLSGRSLPETESLVGFLVNHLVIKIENDPSDSFTDHLQRVKQSVLTSYDHGEYPFQKVAQSLGRQPDPGRNPIYQATLTYQNYPESGPEIQGLSLSDVAFPLQSTPVDLDLLGWPTDEGVFFCLRYATDLLSREAAQSFCRAMVQLSRYLADNHDAVVGDMLRQPFFPDISKRQPSILVGEDDRFVYRSPWERLMDQVNRIPNSPAIILAGEEGEAIGNSPMPEATVSFANLAAMSASYAGKLRNGGVGRENKTVILLYTGVELFVAMLAVWHRNGAWLVVDPEIPQLRLESILREVAPDSVIGSASALEKFSLESSPFRPRHVYTMPDWNRIPLDGEMAEPVKPAEDHEAMYLCSSGSTGIPKIAPCPHDAVTKRLSWEMENFPLGENDLGCFKSSLSYSDFFYEVFVPLLSGVPLLLLGHSPARDIQRLMQLIDLYGVTKLVAVPSVLKAMHRISGGFKDRLQGVRYIRTSGEPMPAKLAEAVVEAIPDVTLYGVYGSMEMHNPTAFCYSRNRSLVDDKAMYLPAGAPLPGRTSALLDDYQLPVPMGERGELFATGWGLTPGYLSGDHKNLFPFLDIIKPGQRWYKSGDMGFIDENGLLHIAGRKDSQLKVRGVRIEAQEVEGAMLRFPGVSEAKVAVWDDEEGNQRLYGFIILTPAAAREADKAILARDIRSFLLESLPAVMVPDYVTPLQEWPRTSTGKAFLLPLKEAFRRENAMVDRREQTEFTPSEKDIARIWANVLGGNSFQDAKTTFFKAGGNSLLLVNLHNELQKKFGRDFPLTVLFQNPTIESQAAYFEEEMGFEKTAGPETLPGGRRGLRSRRMVSER